MSLFDRASRVRERVAIWSDQGPRTYGELLDRSTRVASWLLNGAADLAESRVAFLVPPGFDHVAVQWGIWRAGGIAVPLALSHPPREIEYTLDDAQASIAIASPELADRLEPLAHHRGLRFGTTTTALTEVVAHPLPDLVVGRRAQIIYTSGTTGRPKGVVSSHGNVAAQAGMLADVWRWVPADRSLHVLPLHHVHGIINALTSALWTGAAVEFLHPFDPIACWERLASGEITFFTAVPTVYARLIAAWDAADPATRARWSAGARGLRLMLSGSAALPVGTLSRWEELTGHRLLERYGMTEIGMGLTNPLDRERRAGTVGEPFPGVQIRLVDEVGRPVTPGTPGQIEIKSPQVFVEYWNRPEETARAFRDGWFMTGDVAALENGYYRILGRQSVDIIKSAGYKISALEIEELLREHPAIVDAAVVGLADPDLGERIAAVVVARPGSALAVESLRSWLKDQLAPYKVPRDLRKVTELPRNAMGKVTKSEVKALFAVST